MCVCFLRAHDDQFAKVLRFAVVEAWLHSRESPSTISDALIPSYLTFVYYEEDEKRMRTKRIRKSKMQIRVLRAIRETWLIIRVNSHQNPRLRRLIYPR